MVAIPSQSEIIARARRRVQDVRPDIDSSPESIETRLHFFPASTVARLIFGQLDRVQSIQLLSAVTDADLDAEASNYGLTRGSGKRAKGSVIFFTLTQPASDIRIPVGTIIATDPVALSRTAQFRTLASRTLPGGAGAISFFRRDTSRWESDPIPVEALDTGLAGVVGAGRITVIQSTIQGIDGVLNRTATEGGADNETDNALRNRIARRRLGAERNLRRGLEAFVADGFGFDDAHAVRPDDVDAERPDGVDVWVIDDSTSEVLATFQHAKTIDTYVLPSRPVLLISAVSGSSAGILAPGTAWTFERDVVTTDRFSTRSADRIRILPAGHGLLTEGETLSVAYSIALEVASAQAALDADETAILTADALVKRSIRWTLVIRASVTFFAGVDSAQERARVQLALAQFGAGLGLGDPVQESDIVVAIESGVAGVAISSVDQVVIREITATSDLGEVRRLSDDPQGQQITFGPNEHARFGSISFVQSS